MKNPIKDCYCTGETSQLKTLNPALHALTVQPGHVAMRKVGYQPSVPWRSPSFLGGFRV